MIRVFICPRCGSAGIVSKYRQARCRRCGEPMEDSGIPYTDWVELDLEEREQAVLAWRRAFLSPGQETERGEGPESRGN